MTILLSKPPSVGLLWAEEDPKQVKGEFSSAKSVVSQSVSVVYMILLRSATGPQADKMDTSNKRTFLSNSPIPQMANDTKEKLT